MYIYIDKALPVLRKLQRIFCIENSYLFMKVTTVHKRNRKEKLYQYKGNKTK